MNKDDAWKAYVDARESYVNDEEQLAFDFAWESALVYTKYQQAEYDREVAMGEDY